MDNENPPELLGNQLATIQPEILKLFYDDQSTTSFITVKAEIEIIINATTISSASTSHSVHLGITEIIDITSDIQKDEKIESHSGDPSNAWVLISFECRSMDQTNDSDVSTHYYRRDGERYNCQLEGSTLLYPWRVPKGSRIYRSTQRQRTFANGVLDNHVFLSPTLETYITLRLGEGLWKPNGNRRISLWCPHGPHSQHNKSGGNGTWVYEYKCARPFLPYQGFSYYLVDEVTAFGESIPATGTDHRSASL